MLAILSVETPGITGEVLVLVHRGPGFILGYSYLYKFVQNFIKSLFSSLLLRAC